MLGQDGPAQDDPVLADVGVEAAAQVLDGPGQCHPVMVFRAGEQGAGQDTDGGGLADLVGGQGHGQAQLDQGQGRAPHEQAVGAAGQGRLEELGRRRGRSGARSGAGVVGRAAGLAGLGLGRLWSRFW